MIYLNLAQNIISIEGNSIGIHDASIDEIIQLFGKDSNIYEDRKQRITILKYDLLQFGFVEKSMYTFSIKLYFSDKKIDVGGKLLSKHTSKDSFAHLRKYEQLTFQSQTCYQDEFNWLYIFDEETNGLLEIMKKF